MIEFTSKKRNWPLVIFFFSFPKTNLFKVYGVAYFFLFQDALLFTFLGSDGLVHFLIRMKRMQSLSLSSPLAERKDFATSS